MGSVWEARLCLPCFPVLSTVTCRRPLIEGNQGLLILLRPPAGSGPIKCRSRAIGCRAQPRGPSDCTSLQIHPRKSHQMGLSLHLAPFYQSFPVALACLRFPALSCAFLLIGTG